MKNLQIMQNIKNLMFQVIFIFSDRILIKKIIVSCTPFCWWGKQILKRMLPGGMRNFLLPKVWCQELGASFEWGGAWVKMLRINAFSKNVNSINLKILPTHGGIQKFERKFNKHSAERDRKPYGVYRNMKGCILEANPEGQGW